MTPTPDSLYKWALATGGEILHVVECVAAWRDDRKRLEAAEKVRQAAQLKRNVIIHDDPKFIGRWVAVPQDDFDALRAALAGKESVK